MARYTVLEVVVRYRDEQGREGELRFGPEDRVDTIAFGERACTRLEAFYRQLRARADAGGGAGPAGGAQVVAETAGESEQPGPVCWHRSDCQWICA